MSRMDRLKKYLKSNYNMTVDQATEKWKENLTDQIKTEFIFGLIAEKENIKMDDDAFNSYVDYIVSASNGQFSKASEVYKYFGSGHKDEGKTYLKNQYLVNKAIDTVTEKANVTFEDGSAAPGYFKWQRGCRIITINMLPVVMRRQLKWRIR